MVCCDWAFSGILLTILFVAVLHYCIIKKYLKKVPSTTDPNSLRENEDVENNEMQKSLNYSLNYSNYSIN